MGSINEPERYVQDEDLGLECHIWGHAPVQADGRLAGKPLYFRARWSGWCFTLCINANIDPAALVEGTEPGFFTSGEFRGWAQWGDYGTDREASYMPYAVAEQLIRECSARYLSEANRKEPLHSLESQEDARRIE